VKDEKRLCGLLAVYVSPKEWANTKPSAFSTQHSVNSAFESAAKPWLAEC